MIISPPGIAYVLPMLLSFLILPLSFDNGWTARNADCCVHTVDKKLIRDYTFCELWSSNMLVPHLHGWSKRWF